MSEEILRIKLTELSRMRLTMGNGLTVEFNTGDTDKLRRWANTPRTDAPCIPQVCLEMITKMCEAIDHLNQYDDQREIEFVIPLPRSDKN